VTFGATQTDADAPDEGALGGPGNRSSADSIPLRRCLVTGEQRPKDELLRFVVSPEGILVFDVAGRLPGRGLWLKAGRDMIDTAASKRLFSKAAREAVTVPDDILELVAAGLKRRCLDRLGLARRAGLVAVGFEKVRAQAGTGRTVLMLEAADGAKGGRRKMTSLAPEAPVIDVFTGEELGQALGRDHAVHVSLEADRLTDVLVTEAKRYAGVAF
jgi:uncharacterized protein